jgi:hypothetical protein
MYFFLLKHLRFLTSLFGLQGNYGQIHLYLFNILNFDKWRLFKEIDS